MSVDRTIEELSGTLSQLGILVEHINTQIVGITSRINKTLDNFDNSVAGIATDAGAMTGQVGDTISQVPNAWVFYLLFITLIIVLILLSVLIIINLATRIHAIYHALRKEDLYSESKQPLNIPTYPSSPATVPRHARQVAVPMDSEPRRYGEHGYNQEPGSTAFHRSHQMGHPIQRPTESTSEAYLRRALNPSTQMSGTGTDLTSNLSKFLKNGHAYRSHNVEQV